MSSYLDSLIPKGPKVCTLETLVFLAGKIIERNLCDLPASHVKNYQRLVWTYDNKIQEGIIVLPSGNLT